MTIYGLEFPTNAAKGTDPMTAIQFANPQSDGLPPGGPSNAGVTVIRYIRVDHQASDTGTYYSQFWMSQNDGNYTPGATVPLWGFHPYPKTGKGGGSGHYWEIQEVDNNDYVTTRDAGTKTVGYDAWYLQAIRVTSVGGGLYNYIFYTALPSVADADVIEYTTEYTTTNSPSSPFAITIGDSPWYDSFGHETFCGVQGPIKIFDKVLSEADMLSESADMTQLKTSDGLAHIWWGKNNFDSVDDLTCDYGTGRSFTWYNASYKATLVATDYPDAPVPGTGSVVLSGSPSVMSLSLKSRTLTKSRYGV